VPASAAEPVPSEHFQSETLQSAAPPPLSSPPSSPAEHAALETEKGSVVRSALRSATEIRLRSEEFAKNHPVWAKVGSVALKGAGYLGLTGIVKAGLKLGGKKMMAFFGSQLLSQEVIAAAVEHGAESLVDHAISYASTEQEAVEFAETAVWTVETALAGATVIGVAGLIKDKPALSSKLAATKVNVSQTARAKFSQRQILRTESSQKILAIAAERIPLVEAELAGTGLRVKVPVEEPVHSVSRKMEPRGANKAFQISGAEKKLPKSTKLESKIIAEANGIFNSKEIDLLKTAHMENKPLTVKINGRLVQYEPEMPYSGMTMFGENGFLMGKEAFSSIPELKKTLLHELHRLHTSKSSAGVNAHLVVIETDSAFNFAEKYFKDVK
jgi:hypothetical protein